MFRKTSFLAVFLLVGPCGSGPLIPDVPLAGEPSESVDGPRSAVPLQGMTVDNGVNSQNATADAPQQTGVGFFVDRMECRYTSVGLLTRSFGCRVLNGNAMMNLPASLEARLTIVDLFDLELNGTVQRDPSGVWHWIGEVPNVSAVGASVLASLVYEGKNIDMETTILEMAAVP